MSYDFQNSEEKIVMLLLDDSSEDFIKLKGALNVVVANMELLICLSIKDMTTQISSIENDGCGIIFIPHKMQESTCIEMAKRISIQESPCSFAIIVYADRDVMPKNEEAFSAGINVLMEKHKSTRKLIKVLSRFINLQFHTSFQNMETFFLSI